MSADSSHFPRTGLVDSNWQRARNARRQRQHRPVMQKILSRAFAFVSAAVLMCATAHAQYATGIVGYNAGTGATATHSDPSAALGEPSRVTPGDFGGPVDPFNSPYLNTQLVSLGAGGSLTVSFATPITDHAANPFGLDFQIFGGAGFIITNAFDDSFNFIGTPTTDGSLFGAQTGNARVSVSADGVTYFTLDPVRAPKVEDLYPTDGSGNFGVPVDPSLSYAAFAGKTLAEVRALYSGGGGGVGYDLAWAQDGGGQPISLGSISFVRVEVMSGKAELDGFSAVSAVPEPATWALLVVGVGTGLAFARRSRQSRG